MWSRNPAQIEFAAALRRVLDRQLSRADVRAHALKFSLQPWYAGYYEVLATRRQGRLH